MTDRSHLSSEELEFVRANLGEPVMASRAFAKAALGGGVDEDSPSESKVKGESDAASVSFAKAAKRTDAEERKLDRKS